MGQKLIYYFYFTGLYLAVISCQPDYIQPVATELTTHTADAQKKPGKTCPEYYYTYDQARVNLGQVNTTKIVIGFVPGVTEEEKKEFVLSYAFLAAIETSLNTGSADATLVYLQEGLNCAEVEAALKELAKAELVNYATPVFNSPFGDNLLGITNQFIITLKPGYTSEDLQKYIKGTKAEIVEQLSEETFILSADKYATGNALQLANEFSGFYPVASSEPDFLYLF